MRLLFSIFQVLPIIAGPNFYVVDLCEGSVCAVETPHGMILVKNRGYKEGDKVSATALYEKESTQERSIHEHGVDSRP